MHIDMMVGRRGRQWLPRPLRLVGGAQACVVAAYDDAEPVVARVVELRPGDVMLLRGRRIAGGRLLAPARGG